MIQKHFFNFNLLRFGALCCAFWRRTIIYTSSPVAAKMAAVARLVYFTDLGLTLAKLHLQI